MDKPRLVQVTGDELAAITRAQGELDAPHLLNDLVLRSGPQQYFVDADELARWRQGRASQVRSEGT
jgi:hypothetical protein